MTISQVFLLDSKHILSIVGASLLLLLGFFHLGFACLSNKRLGWE